MEDKEEKFHFENLAVYQKSLDYLDYVYDLVDTFPSRERLALASQFIRAAQSICLNIGEGSGGTKGEFQQYIRVSRRSVRECIVCSTIALRREYISVDQNKRSRSACSEISKMLSGLFNSVR